MNAAMVAPNPGSTTITTPMPEDLTAVRMTDFSSARLTRLSAREAVRASSAPLFSSRRDFCIWKRISDMASVPMARHISGMPALS